MLFKDKVRKKWAFFLTFLCVLLLCGCNRELKSSKEVSKILKEELPHTHFQMIEEGNRNEEGKPTSWTFKMKQYPFLEFSVSSNYIENIKYGSYYTYSTDFHKKLSKYWIKKYKGPMEYINYKEGDENSPYACLYYFYHDIKEIEKASNELEELEKYLFKYARDLKINYSSYYIEKDPSIYCTGAASIYSPESFSKSKKEEKATQILYEKTLTSFTLFTIQNRFWTDYFTDKEISSFIAENKEYHFTIYDDKGTAYYWEDTLLGFHSQRDLSPATLFEVLNRLEWNSLEGNNDAFQFMGINGKMYEFSTGFFHKKPEEEGGIFPFSVDTYYLEDGQEVENVLINNKFLLSVLNIQIKQGWTHAPLEKE